MILNKQSNKALQNPVWLEQVPVPAVQLQQDLQILITEHIIAASMARGVI